LSYTPKINIFPSKQYIKVTCQTPVDKIDTSKFNLTADSIDIPFSIIQTSPITLTIFSSLYPSKLVLQEHAIIDVFNKSTKIDTFIIRPILASTSNFKLQVNTLDTNSFILQLRKGDKLIEQRLFKHATEFQFNNLPAAKYRVLIITDSNGNEIWDTGNTLLSKSPEQLQISQQFELRENWDKELIINVK
jgi:hypothetical protein